MKKWLGALVLVAMSANVAWAEINRVGDYLKKPAEWYASEEAQNIAAKVMSWQSDLGGWPKNVDTSASFYQGKDRENELRPTFDNSATTNELRLLARCFQATKKAAYRDAFLKGYDYILKGQYPNGGWPQFYPTKPNRGTPYSRYITFNDNAMVRVMLFLRESYTSSHYAFLDNAHKDQARKAFDAGVQCILKCQIRVDGKLTAWCAQHDETDFSPRPARTYELVSLSGAESVGIVQLLMSLDNPSPEVVDSVQSAVAWFKAAALHGIRVEVVEDKNSLKGIDHRVVEDPNAPPLWARFYEIGTNQPIFCDRDGVAKHHLSEIGYERRNGYGWLDDSPKKLLEEEYPAWEKHWAAKTNAAEPAAAESTASSPKLAKIKIVLVGDSTVASGSGWGSAFIALLNTNAQGINCAKGGRSSKSFTEEGAWKKALAEKPDYVLIQFGHNDMPGKGLERETDPKTTYPQFMGQYVDEARAIGAKPILVTSLTRRTFGDDGKIHSTLTPYADAVVRLAAEKNVPLIDLHAQSIALHNRLGPKESEKFDMPLKEEKKAGGPDKTHLSHEGAKIIGKLVADELQKAEPSLVPYFQ